MLNHTMNRRLILAPALLLALLLTLVNQAHASSISPQIEVTGISDFSVQPDEALIRLSLTSTMATSKDALNDVGKKLTKFLENLKPLTLSKNSLIAGTIQLSPRYDYRGNQQRFVGFEARRDINITLSDIDLLSKLLDIAVGSGVNQINGITYQSSNKTKMTEKARSLAIEDSQQKAEKLAKAYGAKLGPILNISYLSRTPGRPYSHPEMRMALSDATGTGPFIPGEINFSDQISVVFSLITE